MFVINKSMCVSCHNCASECPRQAIDFVGTKYEIDQEKCVKCGLCAKVCHTGACHEEPKIKGAVQTHDLIERECDIVVVGSGSGLVSAVYAAQQGKKVILLEKNTKIGGNTDYAHGYMPQYSKWHEKMGFADEREEAVEHFYKMGEGIIEKPLVRAAVYGASNFFDWLCTLCDITETYDLHAVSESDFHGPMFGSSVVEFKERYLKNLNSRDDSIGPGWGGTHVIQTMLETIQRENLDVTILMGTAAEHLLLDENGVIKGIMAADEGGQVKINCQAVMLACGGFGQNDELLKKYCHVDFFSGYPMHRYSVPGDTGDAIAMMAELGEHPDPDRMFVSIWGPRHHPFNNSIADYAQEGEFPEINLNGRRWYDESEGIFHGIAKIYQQPEHISYTILPYKQVKAVAERFMNNPAMVNRKKYFETWEYDLDYEATLDTPVKKADTLYELAEKMNVDPETFVNEMTRYSHFCETGVDEDFHKDARFLKPFPLSEGPYYAVFGECFSEAAMGGVTVNDQCEVMRADGSHIPGLYAGGDCTSSMHRKGKLAPISELTWAVASNYIAGGNMVTYINEKETKEA